MFKIQGLRLLLIFGALALAIGLLSRCETVAPVKESPPAGDSPFRNVYGAAEYVGMNTCRACHGPVHDTYIHTGMGKSFDHATPRKSAATFGSHALVRDSINDLYYWPYFADSILYIKEFRLLNGDTIHQRTEAVTYIIGSGHHTNSHLLNINGYVYQAPITYYTQAGYWDLAPGFEDGNNSRFSRLIADECLTCHNHLPKQEAGSVNKYLSMPQGIECERCHGPGSLHVSEKQRGIIIDTALGPDYSIVNPRRLSRELQMDVCQRCHLQGVATLNVGKTFYDFRPGMRLSEVMQVFLPRFTNSHERFIMASQADRMRLSPCYLQSETLSCITCHNPHKSVRAGGKEKFNAACQSCHAAGKPHERACTAQLSLRQAQGDNCVACHMKRSNSIDIPHVTITDHNISKATAKAQYADEATKDSDRQARFLRLEMLTRSDPKPLEMAKGFIALYEKFIQDPVMLDSAGYYLSLVGQQEAGRLPVAVHLLFCREDYPAIIDLAASVPVKQINDAWLAYRIGEAFYRRGQMKEARSYFERATALMPYHLDFQLKMGLACAVLGDNTKAKATFEWIIQENPRQAQAHCNLGYLLASQGDYVGAAKGYAQALALDPDYIQALLNQAALHLRKKETSAARAALRRVLSKEPTNEQARALLKQLG